MTVYVKDTRTGYQQAIVSVAGAIAAHEAAADPHPTYLTSAEGSASFAAIGHNHDASYAAIGHTHAQLHDAATVSDSDTLDLTITGQEISGSVKKQMSIDSDASGLKLSGDSATPGNTKLYGTNASGVKGWYDQPSGGGGGGSSLLAYTSYAAGSDGSLASTSSASWASIDSTNASITFTAPSSGKVLIRAAALINSNTQSNGYFWGLYDGSVDITGTSAYMSNQVLAYRCNYNTIITGLTPSTSYTYKLRHKVGAAGTAGYVYTGPNFGSLIIEVYAA